MPLFPSEHGGRTFLRCLWSIKTVNVVPFWRALSPRWAAVLAGLWWLMADVRVLAAPTGEWEAIEALDAGVEEWRRRVNFFCRYMLRRGVTQTWEDAWAGHAPREERGEGVVVKLGGFMRASARWDQPPKVSRGAGPAVYVSNPWFECVGGPDLQFSHHMGHGGHEPARVSRRAPNEPYPLYGCAFDPNLGPYMLHGGDTGRPIAKFFDGSYPKPDAPGVEVSVQTEGNQLVVRLVRPARRGHGRIVRTLSFLLDHRPPLLVRVESITEHADGSQGMRSVLQGEKVVAVEGGHMASAVRTVMGPARTTSGKITFIYSHWESEDLGQRPPTEEDLVVELGPEVEIVGLKNPPPVGKPRRFFIKDYSLADLEQIDPTRPGPGTTAPPRQPHKSTTLWMVAGGIGLGLIGGVLLVLRAIRKARRQGG